MKDSPVEELRKTLPKGDCEWAGYDHVWKNLQKAAHKMAQTRYVYLSEDHVWIMACMGTGHEETMKYAQMWAMTYGWV